jgi:glycosyltransferase involved in cell wall biosynthesis
MTDRLLVVSDSPCYAESGLFFGFPSVVNELNALKHNFSKVTWIAYVAGDKKQKEICIPVDPTFELKLIKVQSGKRISQKLHYLIVLPVLLSTIFKEMMRHDVIHTRGPSFPVLLALVLAPFFSKKLWWNKYGGDWTEKNAPKTYLWQRHKLKKFLKSKVTIIGDFESKSAHILNFENPSFWTHEVPKINPKRKADFKIVRLVFVGRLTKEKGFDMFMDALSFAQTKNNYEVDIIGDGCLFEVYSRKFKQDKRFKFHGFRNKDFIFETLKSSHFLVLPSKSEGFPKVVSEGFAYGVVPIVSNLSAIPKYIQTGVNGFLWDGAFDSLVQLLVEVLSLNECEYLKLSNMAFDSAYCFSFERFVHRVETEILNS